MKKLLAAITLLAATASHAEIQRTTINAVCGPTDEIVNELKQTYKENVTWIGKDDNGVVTSMWLSKDKSKQTFSILKTTADGKLSCMISSGTVPAVM